MHLKGRAEVKTACIQGQREGSRDCKVSVRWDHEGVFLRDLDDKTTEKTENQILEHQIKLESTGYCAGLFSVI